MDATALALDIHFLVTAFGLRTLVQLRVFGDAGWRLGRPHSAAELAARLLLVGTVGLVLAAALVGAPGTHTISWRIAGIAIVLAANVLVVVAQVHMGDSWRIGVDPAERTHLVTGGVYRWVRNPIYTGVVAFTAGHLVLVPNAWGLAGVLAALAGVELQTRLVEEPFLGSLHGAPYYSWAARSGRFLPVRDLTVIRPPA